jgi:hypothetical protein
MGQGHEIDSVDIGNKVHAIGWAHGLSNILFSTLDAKEY